MAGLRRIVGLSTLGFLGALTSAVSAPPSGAQETASPPPPTGDEAAEAADAPFADLNAALVAASKRLAELTKAGDVARAAEDLRRQLDAAAAEQERLQDALAAQDQDTADLRAAHAHARRDSIVFAWDLQKAVAEVDRLERELAKARAHNLRLRESVDKAARTASQAAAELQTTRDQLNARIDELTVAEQTSSDELARLQAELDQQRATGSFGDDVRHTLEAEVKRLQDAAVIGIAETEGLRVELEEVKARLASSEASNARLEEHIDRLKLAATRATDTARLNLVAVEDRIKEINSALAAVKPEKPAGLNRPDAPQGKDHSRATVRPASRPADINEGRSANHTASPVVAAAMPVPGELEPGEEQIQSLIADLGAKPDANGLSLIVPGEKLFAANSEEIKPEGREALAKVASLIKALGEGGVEIIGHTDAVGTETYNQALSVRRARLVHDLFIGAFKVDPRRLAIEGMGETRPIASNDTLFGRQANRRVEIRIAR